MSRMIGLPLMIFGVVGIGMLIGLLMPPGDWYATLKKPWFNPPNWIFGPVWTLLYIIIAIVGWRVLRKLQSPLLGLLWGIQMALNFLWSPLFFGLQNPGGALILIMALCMAITAFIWAAWRRDRTSAVMFFPYLLWVSFATILNFKIYQLN